MTQYLYGNLSAPFQITGSRDPQGILTTYFYDDYGALYALERGGARYYVGSDHLGTPKIVTDNTGNIIRQVDYGSWGVKTGDTNPSFDLPVGFAGGIPDDATGMVRFGFRDYEPATGRWAAKDPILFKGGLNLYVYVGNSPVNVIDRSGREPCTITIIGGIIGAKVLAFLIAGEGAKLAQMVAELYGSSPSDAELDQALLYTFATDAAFVGGAWALVDGAPAAGSAVLQNPKAVSFATDFVRGNYLPGTGPRTPGGNAGAFAKHAHDFLKKMGVLD